MGWNTTAPRTAFITGAGSGIGAAAAERLASNGWRVAVVDLDAERASAVASRCGREAAAFSADITDQESLDAAVAGAVERFGGIDMCFANAGIATTGTLMRTSPEILSVQVDVNLVGTFRTVQTCLPHLLDSKGYVLLNASASAIAAPPGLGAYGASKAGVENMGDTFRRELKHLGVDVGVAFFLFVTTDMTEGAEAAGDIFGTIRKSLSGPLGKPIPASKAADAIEKGVESRARRVTAPGILKALYRLRGIAPKTLEGDMVKMAPSIAEIEARELAERGELAGMRTDTAATRAAADRVEAQG